MGLDLICYVYHSEKKSLHCTYSYIHVIRYILTQMTIEYLKNIKFRDQFQPESSLRTYFTKSPHDRTQDEEIEHDEQEGDFECRKKRLIDFLSQTLNNKTHTLSSQGITLPINYSLWSQKNGSQNDFDLDYYLNEFGILGLKHFVNHSDCEGYLSYGECIDIMNLFSRIFVFKDKYISKEELKCEDILYIL